MRFLIVEDDPDLLQVILDILKIEGALATAASLGAYALQLLSTLPFAMVLLDLNLPDIEGWQVLDFVRVNQPETPVVVLTAVDSEAVRQRALLSGAVDFMTKPVSAGALVALIKRHLRQLDSMS